MSSTGLQEGTTEGLHGNMRQEGTTEGLHGNMRIVYKPSNSYLLYSPDPITGSSGISLDGQSVVLPDDNDYDNIEMPAGGDAYGDDVSTMNSSHRGGQETNEIKNVETNPTSDDGVTAHSSPANSEDLPIVQHRKSKRCIPLWIRRAPYWLRVIFIGGLALLVAAAVLVGLGVGLSKQESNNASQNVRSPISLAAPTSPPTLAPSPLAPVSQNNPTMDNLDSSSLSQTEVPAATPTVVPSREPSAVPLFQTNAPTETQDPEVFTFYVTGGRYSDDERALVPERLQNLPKNMGTSFLLHIGDWNSPSDGCEEQSYQDVNTLFSTSSIPVYFVPGDNEYNDCDLPDTAFSYWRQYLLNYETKYWDPSPFWSVSRQAPNHEENFSFFSNEIIFVGINMVGGTEHDQQEWAERHAANLEWVEGAYNTYGAEARVMVVFAHAAPGRWKNAGFYIPFFTAVEEKYSDVRVVLIHRNLISQTAGINEEFESIPNLDVVVAEGAKWPPMKVEIELKNNGVDLKLDQELWYDELTEGN